MDALLHLSMHGHTQITQLYNNCPTDSIPVRNAAFGEGIGSILLDNLMCEGHENSLLDCVASEDIATHNCAHSEDAGVRCEGR